LAKPLGLANNASCLRFEEICAVAKNNYAARASQSIAGQPAGQSTKHA